MMSHLIVMFPLGSNGSYASANVRKIESKTARVSTSRTEVNVLVFQSPANVMKMENKRVQNGASLMMPYDSADRRVEEQKVGFFLEQDIEHK